MILSRAFHLRAASSGELMEHLDFPTELARLREAESQWRQASPEHLLANQQRLAEIAFRLGCKEDIA